AMATITPPVAITSYAAATIAGANPMKVGFMSMRVGLVAYILPFVFIFKPGLLQYGTISDIAFAFITAFIGTGLLAMGLEGWFFGQKTNLLFRGLLAVSGILVVTGGYEFIAAAAILVVVIAVIGFIIKAVKKKKAEDINEKT
ncbi:MAG: TRAP transporter permease, partial [Clostridia bacterium]|nr:TRAP transporter permease [Clostridia bacterium]